MAKSDLTMELKMGAELRESLEEVLTATQELRLELANLMRRMDSFEIDFDERVDDRLRLLMISPRKTRLP